jgi:hypothetical protein
MMVKNSTNINYYILAENIKYKNDYDIWRWRSSSLSLTGPNAAEVKRLIRS